MSGTDPYVLAGINLLPFVEGWVSDLEAGGGHSHGLLDYAHGDCDVEQRYSYGGHFLMSNIGPRATKPTASPEELLLFAVLAVYQDADFPGANPAVWEGERQHLLYAFAYAHELGEAEMASRLCAHVHRRSARPRPAQYDAMLRRSLNNDPAQMADHDQKMAEIDSRSFRAAALLDPHTDFDSQLTSP